MHRFVCTLVTLIAFSLASVVVASAAEPGTVKGTIRVEKSLVGTVESVEVVEPTGTATTIEGPARDVLATLGGKEVEVQGSLEIADDGTRRLRAESYAVQ